jgi:hypothetical protein
VGPRAGLVSVVKRRKSQPLPGLVNNSNKKTTTTTTTTIIIIITITTRKISKNSSRFLGK